MDQKETRKYWVKTMLQIVSPVLDNLAKRELVKNMPVETLSDTLTGYAHLEAFGRTLCGLAPWLEAEGLDGEEKELQQQTLAKVRLCLDAASDPESPDNMLVSQEDLKTQPLVDTAFLAEGLLRAPRVLIDELEPRVRENLIAMLRKTRSIVPNESNWILFSSMVEAGLCRLGCPDYDRVRVQYGLRQFMQWYKGDGFYGDGTPFHMDYYNSFVIQPMLVDLIHFFGERPADYVVCDASQDKTRAGDFFLPRAARFATILERMISPEGAYPVVGRSIVYRFGAFQSLSQAALLHMLEEELTPAQVRCALTAVIRRVMAAQGNFDENGWLQLGLYGHQPHLAETYITTGSLYLCSFVFLPLGLSPADPFWKDPDALWTSQKILAGQDQMADHGIF